MDWVYTRRRGPDWKQGWTGQTMASASTPPLPLLAIFAIVMFLLLLSQFGNATYRAQVHAPTISFKLFLFMLPILLVFAMAYFSMSGRLALRLPNWEHSAIHRARELLHRASGSPHGAGGSLRETGGSPQRAGGSPWGVAMLVVLLLVLLSYQSSVQSKWFAPLKGH